MLEEAQQEWAEGIELLRAALTEKRRNPLTRIEEERAWKITPFFERSMRIINRINDILTECSESAAGYKRSLERIDSEQLEVEFNHLQNVKARSESYAKELIAKREHFIQERRRLDDRRRALKSDIDSAAQTIVTKYQDDINHYLEYFGSTTRITEVEAKYPGGKATVSYRIVVGGHNIPLGFSEQEPCFDTVLSEGEKVTLALAFFMARLKDRSVEGMTIVFDDPVNSFGRERRTLTEEAIQNLYERKAQLVVLTHDERLAAMIWRDTRIKHPDIMCLCVEQAGDESKIREWDVEQATTSDYVKDYLALDNYIQNGGDHQAVAARIRPYLEARIRYHFPGPPFTSRDSLGIMISKITASQPGSKLESIKDKVPELNVINRSVLPPHHDMEPDLGVAELTPAEVRIFAEKAINVLG
jgi:wobble nucleotide-excising tRNase